MSVSVGFVSVILFFFFCFFVVFLMIRRPPRSTLDRSSAASDVYKRQLQGKVCNYRCLDSEEEDPISDTGCQFPVQGEDGVYNPAIPTFESSGCFE